MHPKDTIARYVAEGLPEADERKVRAHLSSCESCRAFYDEQRTLMRALAGDVNAPTKGELSLQSALAVRAVFPTENDAPAKRRAPLVDFVDRLLWAPARTLALPLGVVAVLLIAVVMAPSLEDAVPVPLSAHVVHATAASIDGEPLVKGQEVRARDAIRVKKGGMLELSLVRGGTVRVFPGSALALGARGETVELRDGKIWCLPDEGKGRFEVTTKTATVRVLGTSFIVDATAERTDVRVVSGRVEVVDRGARGRVTLARDESTRVEMGRPPTPPRRADVNDDTREWHRFFERLLDDLARSMKILEKQLMQRGD